MDALIQLGIYLGIAVALIGVAIGGIWIKRKFNIKTEEIELARLVLQVIDLIATKGNIKYKGEISIIVDYTIEAFMFIEEFEQTDSLHQKKELVSEKALKICEENGIKPDPDLANLVDQIVDYFI